VAVWIKICGLTSAEGVQAAIECNVNAIGFVFAPSKRQVQPVCARQLAQSIPSHIARVAVMLHPSQQELDTVLSEFRPDVLQTDTADFAALVVPREIQKLPVVRSSTTMATASRVLFEGALSGQGKLADWSAAAALARHTEVILAGGLNPANVSQAIRDVQPFGVDVSSGVESAPGVKDANKIREFVEQARLAHDVR
jgi:phosphoribosylanthranilate isomerase